MSRYGARAAAAALALAVATGVASAPAAGASIPESGAQDCPRNLICVWAGPNFTGGIIYGTDQIGICADRARGGLSMANQMRHAVVAFEFSDCSGANFTLEPGYDTAQAPFPIYSVRT